MSGALLRLSDNSGICCSFFPLYLSFDRFCGDSLELRQSSSAKSTMSPPQALSFISGPVLWMLAFLFDCSYRVSLCLHSSPILTWSRFFQETLSILTAIFRILWFDSSTTPAISDWFCCLFFKLCFLSLCVPGRFCGKVAMIV